jgi:proteasome lid subunit RPN8/RPN11
MDADAMSITGELLDRMKLDAKLRSPYEACGVIIGSINDKTADVTETIPMSNVLSSSKQFIISPNELYHLWKDLEDQGKRIIGAYHSHPDADAGPSLNDIESMKNTSFIWMIIGMDGYARAWSFEGDLKEISIQKK